MAALLHIELHIIQYKLEMQKTYEPSHIQLYIKVSKLEKTPVRLFSQFREDEETNVNLGAYSSHLPKF